MLKKFITTKKLRIQIFNKLFSDPFIRNSDLRNPTSGSSPPFWNLRFEAIKLARNLLFPFSQFIKYAQIYSAIITNPYRKLKFLIPPRTPTTENSFTKNYFYCYTIIVDYTKYRYRSILNLFFRKVMAQHMIWRFRHKIFLFYIKPTLDYKQISIQATRNWLMQLCENISHK